MKVKGNLAVSKSVTATEKIEAGIRVNSGYNTIDQIGGDYVLTLDEYSTIEFIAASTAATATLPDATTLPVGWSIEILNNQVGTLAVRDSALGAVKTIDSGRAYRLKLIDGSTAAGVWYINFLEEADLLPSSRYSSAFDAAGDWTLNGSVYEVTYLEGVHAKGINPMVEVLEDIGGGLFEEVLMDSITTNAAGDVVIAVVASPDARFAGKVLIS